MSAWDDKKEMNEKKDARTMEVVFILDRSGSMCGLEQDTIGGFNSTLKKHKEESSDITWSTLLFDDEIEVVHDRLPVEKVEPLTEKTYYVRGCTALLDAVGCAIKHISYVHRHMKKSEVPDKTLFVITTDGMENSSRVYSYRKVKHMISHEQEKYGWEFIFLGANIDAAEEAGRIGIVPSHAASYVNDGDGIAMNYAAVSCAMDSMMRVGSLKDDVLDSVREDFRKRNK